MISCNSLFSSPIQAEEEQYVFTKKWGTKCSPVFDNGTCVIKPSNGQFSGPSGLAVDRSGFVYVADYFNHRIQKFTTDGVFVKSWGSYGIKDEELAYPQSIAIDRLGFVYVTHALGIVKFRSDGTFVMNIFKQIGGSSQPFGVAVDPAGEFLYSTLIIQNRVAKFTTDGAFVKSWGSQGTGNGQFTSPLGIEVDPTSRFVYVADRDTHKIQKFTTDGAFVKSWGSQGTGNGQFTSPLGIEVDPTSRFVYVADRDTHKIQKFTTDGVFVKSWGSQGTGDGQFNNPVEIAVDSSGFVYVTDFFNSRVQKFTSDGQFVTKFGSQGTGDGQFSNPWGIEIDSQGNVYVSDFINNNIQVFAPGVHPPPPDIDPPQFTFIPDDVVVEAEAAEGTVVAYPDPIAVDDRDNNITPICDPSSGSIFPVGITQVECTATDSSGNTAKATFKVTVLDTTPPSFTSLPSDIVAEATSSAGAMVSYADVVAQDKVDGAVVAVCTPPSESFFPIGETKVTCTATDNAGNSAIAQFVVRVKDTSPPQTQITSAIDGHKKVLNLDGTAQTSSRTISISFTATDNTEISGFQCSLDGTALSSCNNSPITIQHLLIGRHSFQIAAIDRAGNIDASPAELRWEIIRSTPLQAIHELIDHMENTPELSNLFKSGFISRLNAATAYLIDQNPNNDLNGPCGQIDAFIRMVNSFAISNRISMQLASELTQTLPYSTEAIKAGLGCP